MIALILVDIQNDFLPGGTLPVPKGNEIIPIVNKLLALPFDLIIATKDWHPANHGSFAANHHKKPGEKIMLENIEQILWPTHCVQDTSGADLASGWDTSKVQKVFYKGTERNIDSYSTFFDNGLKKSTGLESYLQEHKIREIYIAGLATDYCVKYSVLDALTLGFKVFVITDACRGINLNPNDSDEALKEMEAEGALLTTSEKLRKLLQ